MEETAILPKTWHEVRRRAVADGRIDETGIAGQRRRLEVEILAARLAEIRKAQGVSQEAVAKIIGVTQSRISRLESGDIARTELGTLTAFIRALGGEARLVAHFGDDIFQVT